MYRNSSWPRNCSRNTRSERSGAVISARRGTVNFPHRPASRREQERNQRGKSAQRESVLHEPWKLAVVICFLSYFRQGTLNLPRTISNWPDYGEEGAPFSEHEGMRAATHTYRIMCPEWDSRTSDDKIQTYTERKSRSVFISRIHLSREKSELLSCRARWMQWTRLLGSDTPSVLDLPISRWKNTR